MRTSLVHVGSRVMVKDPGQLWARITNHGHYPQVNDAGGEILARATLDEIGTIAKVVGKTSMTRVLVVFPSSPGGLYIDTLALRTVQQEIEL